MIFLKILVTWLQFLTAKRVCGGTIITEWHILTAAHCVIDEAGPLGIGVLETRQVNVTVGAHNLGSWKDEGAQRVEVAQWPMHDFSWRTTDNDMAILRLKDKIQLGNNVDLIDWKDSHSARYEGKEATTIGWGRIEINTPKVNTPHSPSEYCITFEVE